MTTTQYSIELCWNLEHHRPRMNGQSSPMAVVSTPRIHEAKCMILIGGK